MTNFPWHHTTHSPCVSHYLNPFKRGLVSSEEEHFSLSSLSLRWWGGQLSRQKMERRRGWRGWRAHLAEYRVSEREKDRLWFKGTPGIGKGWQRRRLFHKMKAPCIGRPPCVQTRRRVGVGWYQLIAPNWEKKGFCNGERERERDELSPPPLAGAKSRLLLCNWIPTYLRTTGYFQTVCLFSFWEGGGGGGWDDENWPQIYSLSPAATPSPKFAP